MNWRDSSWVDCAIAMLGAAMVLFLLLSFADPASECIEQGSAVVDGKRYICVEYKVDE